MLSPGGSGRVILTSLSWAYQLETALFLGALEEASTTGLGVQDILWCWSRAEEARDWHEQTLSPLRLGSAGAWHRIPELPSPTVGLPPAVIIAQAQDPGLPPPTLDLRVLMRALLHQSSVWEGLRAVENWELPMIRPGGLLDAGRAGF